MTSIDAIINRQLLKWELQQQADLKEKPRKVEVHPIVTVSRQTGSRGSYFASRLATKLDYQRLHSEVIDAICNSSGYRKRIIESLERRFRGELELMVESMFTGQTVDHRDYMMHLSKVVLSMSSLGGVVLVGRGGNFILGPKRGFHIRFIAPREQRIENLMAYKRIGRREAENMVDKSDESRRQFIAKLYHADIDDPHRYDLVINAQSMDIEDLLEVAITAIDAKFRKLRHTATRQ